MSDTGTQMQPAGARPEAKPGVGRLSKNLFRASKHSLVLLLMGTFLTYTLAPEVSSRAAQARLVREERFKKAQYRVFDNHAWWWSHQLDIEAILLGLDAEPLKALAEEYSRNLQQSAQTVSRVWDRLLAEDYQPQDPANLFFTGN